jgi:cyclase
VSAGSGMPEPYLHDLGNGFHLYVQLDGSWGLNNVGIHVGHEAVTLIDTTMT